jgi:hypothetical protein
MTDVAVDSEDEDGRAFRVERDVGCERWCEVKGGVIVVA